MDQSNTVGYSFTSDLVLVRWMNDVDRAPGELLLLNLQMSSIPGEIVGAEMRTWCDDDEEEG